MKTKGGEGRGDCRNRRWTNGVYVCDPPASASGLQAKTSSSACEVSLIHDI